MTTRNDAAAAGQDQPQAQDLHHGQDHARPQPETDTTAPPRPSNLSNASHHAAPSVAATSASSSSASASRHHGRHHHHHLRHSIRRRRPSSASSPASTRTGRPRAATFRTIEDFDELDTDYHERPGWQPGSEPGYDPRLPDGGHASMPALNVPCLITVTDFSSERVETRQMGNEEFIRFLQEEAAATAAAGAGSGGAGGSAGAAWSQCRWINVNGISWDVMQAVGQHKGLHKLALEDVMNVRNRTKMDWYPNHAFIVMTLQKLVHLVDDDSSSSSDSESDDDSSDSDSVYSRKRFGYLREAFWDLWRTRRQQRRRQQHAPEDNDAEKTIGATTTDTGALPPLHETGMLRSLQRYHASGNEARTEFMERHSSLAPYRMAISAEQVSLFLTADNTVVSVFESSAGDVERPMLSRLCTRGTVLRESCDASLLVQAVIDAVIDLAIPLTAVYTDMIGDLELDVLTAPSVHLSRSLYICTSEINKMLSFLGPIENLVNGLRDHRTTLDHEAATAALRDPTTGVVISPQTHTYLGDVLDHCIIVTEGLRQLRLSSDNLISLIFNTISATQNESMKQLTAVTIIFLPLTFITGFFGQNFPEEGFPEVKNGIWYFWACAIPTALATVLILMRDQIYAALVRLLQRKHIGTIRRNKKASRKSKKKSNKRKNLASRGQPVANNGTA